MSAQDKLVAFSGFDGRDRSALSCSIVLLRAAAGCSLMILVSIVTKSAGRPYETSITR